MTNADDFLVEIGTEEMPPTALRALMDAFGAAVETAIDEAALTHGPVSAYASPRRLAVTVTGLAHRQETRSVEQKGPPVSVAFDKDGNPTAAAEAFAKKCGVEVSDLTRQQTAKGEWLFFASREPGKATAELMPGIVERALGSLPIPRRMRWGDADAEFVRPVHWVVMLHGSDVIEARIMDIGAGNQSLGHRFHSSGPVTIDSPADYLAVLEEKGRVIADFERRRGIVQSGVEAMASAAGGRVVDGESLYDEVTALVEWPVPLLGNFDKRFLALPHEVVISTLTGHQRYFPVAGDDDELLPLFITVANIESTNPDAVREGNERVVLPRLADAEFFWESDRRSPLASREDALREVIYQAGLGSLYDKSRRTAAIGLWLGKNLGVDTGHIERAAALAKCDLLTGMVGEFPELQGIMGGYYARSDGEPDTVADAIGEHYRPRFAGDSLPATPVGQVLAVADRLDTLAGVFSIGKKPSGNRDPFGLRRAALGVVRILIECSLDIDLKALIGEAIRLQPKSKADSAELELELYGFICDRLRRYFLDRDSGLGVETFEAIMVRQPESLVDFDRRLAAVQTFARLEQAESLSAANKRTANILRKAGDPEGLAVRKKLFQEPAEKSLYNAVENAREKVLPMIAGRSYAEALNTLADLRDPVDRFFDEVMVMADDQAVQNNRLALLGELRALFLDIADISRLSVG